MKKEVEKEKRNKLMTFRLTPKMHKEFKIYCVQNNKKIGELINEFVSAILKVANGKG